MEVGFRVSEEYLSVVALVIGIVSTNELSQVFCSVLKNSIRNTGIDRRTLASHHPLFAFQLGSKVTRGLGHIFGLFHVKHSPTDNDANTPVLVFGSGQLAESDYFEILLDVE
jgi:hypothetical protein